jgi:hypothetical protein
MSGAGKPEFIQPPSTLKDKVSVSANGVDLKALEEAAPTCSTKSFRFRTTLRVRAAALTIR